MQLTKLSASLVVINNVDKVKGFTMKNSQNKVAAQSKKLESQIYATESNISPKLTTKQENFCLAYINASSATEAYRQSYNASGIRPATLNRMANELMKNHKITSRIEALRAPAIEKAKKEFGHTLEGLLCELDLARARALAATPPHCSAAIAASMGKAKLLGLLVDKVAVSTDSSIASLIRELDMKTIEQSDADSE